MFLDPQQASDWRQVYRFLNSLVLPRPVAWVSTQAADGALNLAPFSFFNVVCAQPPTIVFCPMVAGRTGKPKDTLNNLGEVPEFVVHVVSRELVEKMNLTSGEFAKEVDEFEVAGLTPVPSRKVGVPRIKEAHAVMECRLREILRIGEGPGSGALVLGEVLLFEVDDKLFVDGEIDIDALDPIGRLGGADYCTVKDRFALQRPDPEALGARPRQTP